MTVISAADFEKAMGQPPTNDDLDRVNCREAGKIGHLLCGWCKHERPRFSCQECGLKIGYLIGEGLNP